MAAKIARLDVLVVGLAEAGVVVVRALLGQARIRMRVFDPRLVTRADVDVGSFYKPEDLGMPRDHVVMARIVANDGTAPDVVSAIGASFDEVETALTPFLKDIDVAVLCDDPSSRFRSVATSVCHSLGVPMVSAGTVASGGIVGPSWIPGRSDVALGCPECAELHRADHGPPALSTAAAFAESPQVAVSRNAHRESDLAILGDIAVLACCQVIEVSRGERHAEAQAMTLDFERHTVKVERVSKHPACRLCYPSAANGTLRSALARAGTLLRKLDRQSEALPTDLVALRARLAALTGERYALLDRPIQRSEDARAGVWRFFRERGVDPRASPLANAHAASGSRTAVYAGQTIKASSEGLDFSDLRAAEALALIEGLERLFALFYCDTARVVQASYEQVAADAFDPRQFPLYADWQYAEPNFPLGRFQPDEPIRWLGAVDLGTRRPVLVPYDLVYGDHSAAALYEPNSNGAACHTSLHQAIVNGIYEIVERDALMVAWLDRLSLPRATFAREDVDPWGVRGTLERLDLLLEHVDITTDLGIPVLMGVLRDRRNPDLFLVDMVAHLDPQRRVSKLYRELTQFAYPYLASRTPYVSERTRGGNPDSVRTFEDHVTFYQDAGRNALASFLTGSPAVVPFGGTTPSDGADELPALLQRLSAAGLRVLVVDCTEPLLQELGLHAVKVLIPGLLQLNADHRLRVLVDERLREVPRRLGIAGPQRVPEDLNPWPHPFW